MSPFKTMKTLLCILLLLPTVTMSQNSLTVATAESKATWTGTKVMGFHQGTVKLKDGRVIMHHGKLVGGNFTIDLTTIECTDIPASDPIPKKKLETHLKSDAFFDVTKFPTATFVIKEVSNHPEDAQKLLVRGDLTIKGITREVKIQIEPSTQSDRLFITQASIRFDRQRWGVAYKGLKDELVHDEVQMDMIIKAK